jgi:hypothetical protein
LDVRPRWFPLSRSVYSGCGVGDRSILSNFVPLPLSHRIRVVYDYRVSRVHQFRFTIAASVTWASWAYGSPAPLARVPTKLGLMPAAGGYSYGIGWVRTRLPYQTWHASRALRHGLAPRPHALTALPLWACYGIVGGVFAGVGVVLLVRGTQQLARIHLVPQNTAATIQENVPWLNAQVMANSRATRDRQR